MTLFRILHDIWTFVIHLHCKKKWSDFNLKRWATGGTKNRPGIPSNWKIFESNWLDIESQIIKFDSNIIQLFVIQGRILVSPVTQLFLCQGHLVLLQSSTRNDWKLYEAKIAIQWAETFEWHKWKVKFQFKIKRNFKYSASIMDTALSQLFPFILDRNLAKANCSRNRVCTSCDTSSPCLELISDYSTKTNNLLIKPSHYEWNATIIINIINIIIQSWKVLGFLQAWNNPALTHFLPMSTFGTVLLKFWFYRKEAIMEKISYERLAYESVDDKSSS